MTKKRKKPATTLVAKAKKFGKDLVKEFGKNPRKPPLTGRRKKL